jgi:hypothetical protein
MVGGGIGLGECSRRNKGLGRALGVIGDVGRTALRSGVGGVRGAFREDGFEANEDNELKDEFGLGRPVPRLERLEAMSLLFLLLSGG